MEICLPRFMSIVSLCKARWCGTWLCGTSLVYHILGAWCGVGACAGLVGPFGDADDCSCIGSHNSVRARPRFF